MSKQFKILEVNNDKRRKEFLYLPVRLYKNEKFWIRPLDEDIEGVFDPKQNKFFRNGEAVRWLLLDEADNTIGRVAAFYDKKTAYNNDQPTGGMGFFECINDKEAAFKLFDQCKEWLESKGMEAMDGPVNFGDRDRWWGLLVDGFEYEPNYCMPYNFLYYKDFFEEYGFKNFFNQYTYARKISKEGLDPVIEEKAMRIRSNPKYHFENLKKNNIQKYTEDFRDIYNRAWSRYSGVKKITKAHANALMKSLKPILDERLLWFAYYDNDPIAFFLMVPDANQIVKYLNGKMNLLAKIKFVLYKKFNPPDKVLGLIFGVVPEHQGKGVEGGLVMAFGDVALRKNFPYRRLELNWIGDFNPTMMKVAEQVGARILKTHVTYRYLFDRNKPFKREKKVS
jgi:GNAT superfamily N-acetyltransferase